MSEPGGVRKFSGTASRRVAKPAPGPLTCPCAANSLGRCFAVVLWIPAWNELHETDLSAQQPAPQTPARVPAADVDQGGPQSPSPTSSSRPQAAQPLKADALQGAARAIMWPRLKHRRQFDLVYSQGRKRTGPGLV